ncbi:MAG: RHS repeat-associated core domain-containing protein [Archangium sp.]|nr:RHS repeat-associated core domain-containing protein [Archangium sp.]
MSDGLQMVQSYNDGTGGALGWNATWGVGLDALISVEKSGTEYFALDDGKGSVVGWVQGADVVARAEYTPEGRGTYTKATTGAVCAETGGTRCGGNHLDLPFGFHSALQSRVSGLLYFRNRWYSSETQQWLSQDPLDAVDSFDLYAFNAFDSVNNIDPLGLDASQTSGGDKRETVIHCVADDGGPCRGARAREEKRILDADAREARLGRKPPTELILGQVPSRVEPNTVRQRPTRRPQPVRIIRWGPKPKPKPGDPEIQEIPDPEPRERIPAWSPEPEPEINDPRTNPPWFPPEGILTSDRDLTIGQVEALKAESFSRRQSKKPLRIALGLSGPRLNRFTRAMGAITWFEMSNSFSGSQDATIENIRFTLYAVVGLGGQIVFNLEQVEFADRPSLAQVDRATERGTTPLGGYTEQELALVRSDPVLYSATVFYVPTPAADIGPGTATTAADYQPMAVPPFIAPPFIAPLRR